MGDWLITREQAKRAADLGGKSRHNEIDRNIESASRNIERATRRRYLPLTTTRLYRWPNRLGVGDVHWLDEDLLSTAPTIKTKAQDASPTTLTSTEYFLESYNHAPPFNRVEINISKQGAFEAGDTPQRSISIAGDWGYGQDTRIVTTLQSSISASGSTLKVFDASKVGVGHTLLVGTERIFISEVDTQNLTRFTKSAINNNMNTISLGISSTGSTIKRGEVVRIDQEDMWVEEVETTAITVTRAYDGTLISTHSSSATIKAYRAFTVERGANGSTATAHTTGSTVKIYEPPFDVQELVVAEVVAALSQERSAWGRIEGQGEGARLITGKALSDLRERTVSRFLRVREAAI